jgi:hypothetical protein
LEKPFELQDEVSWLSAICGAIGIILLAVYIIWGSGDKDEPASKNYQKAGIQQKISEP